MAAFAGNLTMERTSADNPFYSTKKKTSAEIISEAKASIEQKPTGPTFAFKLVDTKRPFTPKPAQRTLFGGLSSENRPPSSFGIQAYHFDDEIRPVSSGVRLEPLENRPTLISPLQRTYTEKVSFPSFEATCRGRRLPAINQQKTAIIREDSEEGNEDESEDTTDNSNDIKDQDDNIHISDVKVYTKSDSYDEKLEEHTQSVNYYISFESQEPFMEPGDLTKKTRGPSFIFRDIVTKLKECLESGADETQILLLLVEYEDELKKFDTVSSRVKCKSLRVFTKLTETTNCKVLLKIAHIALMFGVTGSNKATVCKIIYQVTHDEINDELFKGNCILDLLLIALGNSSPSDDAEACIYGYGALRFLTANEYLLSRLLELGILDLVVLQIKWICSVKSDHDEISGQTHHVLYQLTGILRNIAADPSTYSSFVSTGAIVELCLIFYLFDCDIDVVCIASRALSILSTNDECCTEIVNQPHVFATLINLLDKYSGRHDIIVRLAYGLGNIMAKNENGRIQFYEEKYSIKSLLDVLESYVKKIIVPKGRDHLQKDDLNDSVEDVVIKLTRVVANLSIDESIGLALANNVECVELLLTVLQLKTIVESEELVLCTLSTFNNLCFYCNGAGILSLHTQIVEALLEILNYSHDEGAIEATRVLGNLALLREVRDYLMNFGFLGFLVTELSNRHYEMLRVVLGVLVNMTADHDKRDMLQKENASTWLVQILFDVLDEDWHISTLVLQALWNCFSDPCNVPDFFGEEEIKELNSLLTDLTDDNCLQPPKESSDTSDQVIAEYHKNYELWQDFFTVAVVVKQKLATYLSDP